MSAIRTFLALALVALVACSVAGPDPPDRVVLIAVDGADWSILRPMIEAGRLPHFARMVREGASGNLHSLPGYLSPALWTTIATGALPEQHGILDFTYPGPDGTPQMVTSNMRRRRAVWDLVSERGRPVGVYGWLATWPAYPVEGTLVSSYVPYLLEREGALEKVARPMKGTYAEGVPELTFPAQTATEMRAVLAETEPLIATELERFADFGPLSEVEGELEASLLKSIRFSYAADRGFVEIARRKYEAGPEDFHSVYVGGIDVLSHRMWRFVFESPLTSTESQRSRFGRSIPEYYRAVDEWIGWYLERMPEDTTLVVCSDHGFRGMTRELPGAHNSGTHRLTGVILMVGPDIEPGTRLPDGATLLDVAPTLLTLLGLPAAEDMPGNVLAQALTDRAGPVEPRVASYETTPFGGGQTSGIPSAVDEEVLNRLRSLGYLGEGMAAEE